ncbi:MAG: aminotransferase class III-fold pyridoxal phosphate-dependent enzyme, partial [Planctomycetales bacterium]|nr:aminotransferase class III-fold pyridoxal phosphate-dependent enzyme [Planctomycetales bacterium]
TTGAMSVCDPDDSMHAHFKGFLLEQYPAAIPQSESDFAEFESFVAAKSDDVAGVIIEPLAQMATGMKFHSPAQLKRVFEITKTLGLLFIADEIATGFWRTGTMFAIEQASIVPDIISVGKALTGGVMTLSATAVTDEVYSAFHSDEPSHALMHGPTYMGNPLACAAANASLDLFENYLPNTDVSEMFTAFADNTKAEYIANTQSRPNRNEVVDARSLGALLAIEFAQPLPPAKTRDFFLDRGVWLRPIGNVLYVCPALNMRIENLQIILSAIEQFLQSGTCLS